MVSRHGSAVATAAPLAYCRSVTGRSSTRAAAVDDAADAARAAVAYVRPRMRGVLHATAFPLSLAAGAWAVAQASTGTARVATAVYAATLSACLGVSAAYHRGHWSSGVRSVLRRIDHAAIYLLIAGTFTPVAVLALSGWVRALTLAVVWGGGAAGIAVDSIWNDAPRVAQVLPYVAIGGFGVVLMPSLVVTLGIAAVALLACGGATYITGAVVFARRRPDPWPGTFGFHEVFHALVVTAATMQWVAITRFLLPAG